ncbi:hypothetical protein BD626DRAFT_633973 [Schizophyllum amplum]|uniref:HMG box domain-containing protein n=1 Tax=Schizophyllum amplum TaxID=97359 RepID=A0A550C104_9AGAR|nr:hypothetical protein BD626DRAFT_633973 [Auriculariopsis ampla]
MSATSVQGDSGPSSTQLLPAQEARIPRPPNSWILFRDHFRRNFAPSDIIEQSKISKAASPIWRGLTPKDRAYWDNLANEEKVEHRRKYPDYKYQPQTKKGKKRKRNTAAEDATECISFDEKNYTPSRATKRAKTAAVKPEESSKVPMRKKSASKRCTSTASTAPSLASSPASISSVLTPQTPRSLDCIFLSDRTTTGSGLSAYDEIFQLTENELRLMNDFDFDSDAKGYSTFGSDYVAGMTTEASASFVQGDVGATVNLGGNGLEPRNQDCSAAGYVARPPI